ncbi:DUF1345 domain-containing protein [Novimethylophilus kurashikiensis]|nr:DUF1345 domain-containing protein [Novimethylophilus kurashikiensis]
MTNFTFEKCFMPSNLLTRQVHARPRLLLSIVVGSLVALMLPKWLALHAITRIIIGWSSVTTLYLALSAVMMYRSSHEQMRHRAQLEDEGQFVILTLVMLAALASLAAIVAELGLVKDMKGGLKYAHIGLAAFTIVSSWFFTHVMFALHYAHDYYASIDTRESTGLDFPHDKTPSYSDFLYFSFVIGTSGQTADVSFTSKRMRKIGLAHCVLAFFFNTTILALTINIAASLI